MSLLPAVLRTIRRHGLLPQGTRVCVTVSGGADSVALFHILRNLAPREGFEVVSVCHLNHQLRGDDADKDEEFCRRLAAEAGVPFHAERIDIAARAESSGTSIEHAAHEARHECYARAAEASQASVVAVGHTKDDQAETFLLRLIRGAGPRGLGGMHPRSGIVVRPLIETRRADVRAYIHASGLTYRDDASNDDVGIPRNRVRHELMPLLEARFSSGIVDVLDRGAQIAREDADYLEAAACAAAETLIAVTPRGVEIDSLGLLSQHPAIGRRVVRLAIERASGGTFTGFDAADAVLAFAVSKSSGPIDLPGCRANRFGAAVVLSKSAGRAKPAAPAPFSYRLDVPGRIRVDEAGCVVSGVRGVRATPLQGVPPRRGEEVMVDAARLVLPLTVRSRLPGDRVQPRGLGGRKKLQDVFVDAKVDRAARDVTPVVVDAGGRIVWVAGHLLAEEFTVTDATTDVVILKRERIR